MTKRPSDNIRGLPDPLSEQPWSTDFVMQAIEILPVALDEGALTTLRPEHADSFIIAWPAGSRPEEVSARALERLGFRPVVLHSTSWRNASPEVVLTYIAVVKLGRLPDSWLAFPVQRAELARGDTLAPPPVIGVSQVLEHALRHLSWLVKEDPTISATLPDWAGLLQAYVPEPFRSFAGAPGD
jgi:hypothetical protein